MAKPSSEVYWYGLQRTPLHSLTSNLTVDLAVVGGGMAGLMCAQQAAKRGLSVAILESQFVAAGASGQSSGFITPDSELELSDLIEQYGPKRATELWEFVTSGCEAIRQNILDYNIECDYQVQDSLFIANRKSGRKKVQAEHAARQSLNYNSTIYESHELQQIIGSNKYYGGVRYPGTFGIIPYLYCQQLKDILIKQGIQIFENTKVIKLDGHSLLTSTGHKINAGNIVFCADHFLADLGLVPKDIYHAQTFLGISKPLTTNDQKKLFPQQSLMVWSADLIYQYFRLTGESRLLIGGSSLIYTYLPWKVYAPRFIIRKFNKYLKTKFPGLSIELEYLWPGFIGVSKDFLPLAGVHHELPNVYYIGGAAGLPWAAALGRYIADKIAGDKTILYDNYFKTPRKYPLPYALQSILGKPITFALSHGITKYLK